MAWTTPKTWAFQEGVESSELNTYLRDNQLVTPHIIPKTANQSVTSSIVLVDDTELQFAIGASEAWEFRFVLFTTGPGFLRIALNAPTGATGWWVQNRTDVGAVQMNAQAAATFVDGEVKNGTSTPDQVNITGFCLNSTTAGTFKLRWAQTNSNATATIVLRGSRLERRKV